MRFDALPGLGGPRERRGRDEYDEECADRREDAALKTPDEQRADRARRQRGDHGQTEIAGLDRQTLFGLRRGEDEQLRREREAQKAEPAAAVRERPHDLGDRVVPVRAPRDRESDRAERAAGEKSKQAERDVLRGKDQVGVGTHAQAGQFGNKVNADSAQRNERAKNGHGSRFRVQAQATTSLRSRHHGVRAAFPARDERSSAPTSGITRFARRRSRPEFAQAPPGLLTACHVWWTGSQCVTITACSVKPHGLLPFAKLYSPSIPMKPCMC